MGATASRRPLAKNSSSRQSAFRSFSSVSFRRGKEKKWNVQVRPPLWPCSADASDLQLEQVAGDPTDPAG